MPEHEKFGLRARPFSDSLVGVPFKKRHILFTRSPSPPPRLASPQPRLPLAAAEDCGVQCKPESSGSKSPPQLPFVVPEDCGVQHKPESSESESPLSKAYSHPVQVDAAKGNISAVTGKEVSSKSREEPKNGDLNPVGKPDTVLLSNDPGLSLKGVGNSTTGADTKGDMVPIDKVGPAMGSVELLSVMQDTLGMPVNLGSDEGKIVQSEPVKMGSDEGKIVQSEPVELGSDEAKIVQSEGISVKRENIIEKPLLSKHSTAELKIDVGHFSLSRSNWDLNTPMDTWEGSKTDSNSGTIANGRLELGETLNKVLDSGLEQSLYREPSTSNVTLGNCNVQTNDQELNLFNQCTLMREHTSSENSLDLHFKPSFLSNCTTSANFQCLREKPFLSLSMKPMTMVSSHSPQLDISRVVKSEHYESRYKESRKVDEIGDSNSLGMNHVKSEPYEGHEPSKTDVLSDLNSVGSVAYEGHETSQTNVLSDLNSVGSVAVKPEPLEDHSRGCSRSPEVRSFSMEKVGHALSLQSMDMHQRAGKFDGSSVSKCKSPESNSLEGRSVLMELGGHCLSLQSAEVLQNAHKFDSKMSHLTCMSSGLDESMLRSDPQNHSTHIPEYSNEMVSKEVKPEPLEEQSQGCSRSPERRPSQVEPTNGDISYESTEMHEKAGNSDDTSDKARKCTEIKSVEGKSLQIELGGYGLSVQSAEVLQDAGKVDGKTSDLTFKSPELDIRTLHSDTQDPSTDISEYSNEMVGKALDVGNQDSTSINGLPPASVNGDPAKETVTKASDLVLRPMIPDGNESNPVKEFFQIDNMPLPPGPLASDSQEHMTTDGLSKSTQMDSFGSSQIDEPLVAQYENCKVLECDEIKNLTDMSSETLDKLCEFEFKADISHVVVSGSISTRRKQSGMDHEDFEDGEVRDPALASSVEGPGEEREDKQAKDSGLISSTYIEVSLPVPSPIVEEISMQNSIQVECDTVPCDNEDGPNFASIGELNVDSGENQPSKTIREISKDNLKKPEINSKSDAILITDTVTKGCLGDVSNQQENAEGSHLMSGKISELFETEPSENNGAAKDVTDRGQNSRIIYLSSSYNKLASEKMKSDSGWSRSSQIQRENTAGRPFKQDKSRSWGSRDESPYDKPRKFEVERRPFHQVGKHVTGFVRNRSRADDQPIPLHGNKNTDSDQFLEHTNSLIGARFHRRVNNSEISSWDGSNRMIRKPRNEQMQNLSHMPCRGRPRRGQVMPLRHPFRGNSPGRSEREIPDFVLAHGENLMRNSPDGMIEPPIPSHPHSQYERAEGSPRRRGTGLRLPVNGPNSFSRAQRCSPHQWRAPGRSPDGYTGPPELVRRRSPQVIGLGRMRSPPQQRPCFPEDMIVRRHGSPPYVTRLPDDVMDMVPPARERDFPRRMRGSNRNMQRFNLIDRRESAEEYFGPPQHGQIREFDEDDDYADDRRRSDERPGPIHSFRQHFVTGDDDAKRFRFHAEDGPPRPFRICPETADGFCEAGSPRDFSGRFRNRLGNASGRSRDILGNQDDDYRHHEDLGWHDAGFGEARIKRRRF